MTLLIDNEVVITLEQLISDNSQPDVESIDQDEIEQLKALKIGERYTLDFGAGGQTFIQRIS